VELEVRPITSLTIAGGEPMAEPSVTELVAPLVEQLVGHHVRLARVAVREYTEAADIRASYACGS
jgi:hypothetical protein